MLSEELSEEDALLFISKLRAEHHEEGPNDDHNMTPGSVCVFLYPYKNIRLYIKLKLLVSKNGEAGAVLSFHDEGNYD